MKKIYWKSLDEYKGKKIKNNKETSSFSEILEKNNSTSRRDFLKLFGFSLTTAALYNSCEQPVTKAIPYLIKPEEVTPGTSSYYASTFFDGDHFGNILVKVRDGRPIKIEGNTLSPFTEGGTSAIIQASVLNLYDTNRHQTPLKEKNEIPWETIDKEIPEKLARLVADKKNVVLLTSTIASPSMMSAIEKFKKEYNNVQHVIYDPVSYSSIRESNMQCFGRSVIPSYHFEKASLIVSFGADFLGTWLSPIEFTRQYIKKRRFEDHQKEMSKHIQIESSLSLTGSNADERYMIKPSREKFILSVLYKQIAHDLGMNEEGGLEITEFDVKKLASELIKNKGKSLIVSGSNDIETQTLVNGINYILNNYGQTVDLTLPMMLKQGDDKRLQQFITEIKSRKISGMLIYNVNPAYDLFSYQEFKELINKMELSVSFSCELNETSSLTEYVCPDLHFLESWGDVEIKPGYYGLIQPAMQPLFNTRLAAASLLTWTGDKTDYLTYLKNFWKSNILNIEDQAEFQQKWDESLQKGIVIIPKSNKGIQPSIKNGVVKDLVSSLKEPHQEEIELVFYENVNIGNGRHANNPWLQELPDPISKVTWDNYAAISLSMAERENLVTGDIIKINSIEFPVVIQPGQAPETISIAVGYGKQVTGKVAQGVGVNAYELMVFENGNRQLSRSSVKIEKTEKKYEFAITQDHHEMEGRPLAKETSFEAYLKNPASGNEDHEEIQKKLATLYPKFKYPGHHWGLAVNLSTCTGCNACVVACSSENNIPVVGKNEVKRDHEMHWIRIDRYYKGNPENPEVVRQPVMCQHCNNAPCENVCPVLATTHSSEGINQMAYNRCIGTRYCNNNCPYKVRRFNWFDYTKADAIPKNEKDTTGMTDDLRRMVLNPDVTVRAKGVIEKCTFCIQRIQEKKLQLKLENRTLSDGELKTACAQACPADALIFGDLSDENSRVSKLFKNERNYFLLEELHTLPNVGYLTRIKNVQA